MKCVVIELDKKTGDERAVATLASFGRASREVERIRAERNERLNRRYTHKIRVIRQRRNDAR